MPDWKKLVRERLSSLDLPPDAKEEVIVELSAHLEDSYQNELALGLTELQACESVLSKIQWNQLACGIRRATLKEESMNSRMKTLWLPAAANLLVAAVMLILLEKLGADARMTNACYRALIQLSMRHRDHASYFFLIFKFLNLDLIHLPWLLALPLSATAGCLMARRAQAPAAIRLMVGLAPSLLFLAVFVVMVVVFELDRWQFPTGFPLESNYFALTVIAWTALPSLPLLLGTLPFLREAGVREA